MHRSTVVWLMARNTRVARAVVVLSTSLMHAPRPGRATCRNLRGRWRSSRGRHPTEIRSIFHGSPRKSLDEAPLTSRQMQIWTRVDNAARLAQDTLYTQRAPWMKTGDGCVYERGESSSTRSGVSSSLITDSPRTRNAVPATLIRSRN